jgi:hypothetical protein
LSVNILFNNIGIEQAQALADVLKEHATLKSLCGNKGNETELDMSGKPNQRLGAEGAIMLAPEIADNGALTSLNMSANGPKGAEAGKALGDAVAANTSLKELDISGGQYDSQMCDAEFVKTFSVGLRDNRALAYFNISKNGLSVAGAKVLGEALRGNQVMTEINISSNYLGKASRYGDTDISGVVVFAGAIPDMGALSKLIFGGDPDAAGRPYEPATLEVGMTEADFGNKNLGVGGAIVISAWISHKDNRAMTSLCLASTGLGVEGAKLIAAVLPKCT